VVRSEGGLRFADWERESSRSGNRGDENAHSAPIVRTQDMVVPTASLTTRSDGLTTDRRKESASGTFSDQLIFYKTKLENTERQRSHIQEKYTKVVKRMDLLEEKYTTQLRDLNWSVQSYIREKQTLQAESLSRQAEMDTLKFDMDARLESAQSENSSLRDSLSEVRKELEELRRENSSLREKNAYAEEMSNAIRTDLLEFQNKLNMKRTRSASRLRTNSDARPYAAEPLPPLDSKRTTPEESSVTPTSTTRSRSGEQVSSPRTPGGLDANSKEEPTSFCSIQ